MPGQGRPAFSAAAVRRSRPRKDLRCGATGSRGRERRTIGALVGEAISVRRPSAAERTMRAPSQRSGRRTDARCSGEHSGAALTVLDDPTEVPVPTPEQDAIAAAPPNARLLVTAGAGTGKTYVLVERLRRLADDYGLNLADDVLVVSFSRAAVGEIRRRLRSHGGAPAYGTVTTFDSFAT